MANFVFADFFRCIKDAWNGRISDTDLITILYDAIAKPIDLTNKNGDPIIVSKSDVSEIVNRKANVRRDICEHAHDEAVSKSINSYFKQNIIDKLNPESHEKLIQQLKVAIDADNSMVNPDKDRLIKEANNDNIAEFLVAAFLYTLSVPNKSKTTKGIGEELSGDIFLYRSSIFESEIPKGQIKPFITDFDKFNNVQIQNIDPSKLTENLEDDKVYKITTEFTFDERYKDSKRKIILSATWNNVTIKGETSIENWTSESYVNNCADAGRKTVTAIFKILNSEKNIVQYLFVLEVR